MKTSNVTSHVPISEKSTADYIWDTIHSFMLAIKDGAMSNSPSSSSADPARIPLIIPSVQTRRAACTHLTMNRLYGPYECAVCQQPSPFGWLYSCTQDDAQGSSKTKAPAATDGTEQEKSAKQLVIPDESISQVPAPETPLNHWVEKAILGGHYTPAQVVRLRAQKQKVVDAIAAAEEHFKSHPENISDVLPSISLITSPSAKTNSKCSDPIVPKIYDIKNPEPTPTASALQVQPKPSMFPQCQLHYCQTCRPTFRDRTWVKFGDVFAESKQSPKINFERDNRPVCQVSVMRKLGLQEVRPSRPSLRHLDSARRYSLNVTRQLISNNLYNRRSANLTGSSGQGDQGPESESKGFRDGVKRAFRGMLKSRRRDSVSARSSQRVKAKEADSVEFDMGLWHILNNELLDEASNVPLPGHDGTDGLGGEEGEVEVEEGVAVTEEGVDLGMADIIMSI